MSLGELVCGSPAVANATLNLPRLGHVRAALALPPCRQAGGAWDGARSWAAAAAGGAGAESEARGLGRRAEWLRLAILPQHRVVFLDTDAMPATEARVQVPHALRTSPPAATATAAAAASASAAASAAATAAAAAASHLPRPPPHPVSRGASGGEARQRLQPARGGPRRAAARPISAHLGSSRAI